MDINGGKFAMTLVMLSICVAMVGIAAQYPPDARFMPFIVGIPAIALCLLQLALDFRASRRNQVPAVGGGVELRRELLMWAYFIGLVVGILLFGFLVTIPVFVVVFLRHWARASWRFALGLTAAASVVLYLALEQGLGVVLHPGFVTEYLLEGFSG